MKGQGRTVGSEFGPFGRFEREGQSNHVSIEFDRLLHVAYEDDRVVNSHVPSLAVECLTPDLDGHEDFYAMEENSAES